MADLLQKKKAPQRGVYGVDGCLDFPSLDPVRAKETADLKRLNIEAEWQEKKDIDDLEAKRKSDFLEEMAQVSKQGGLNRLLPGHGYVNGGKGFEEWKKAQIEKGEK